MVFGANTETSIKRYLIPDISLTLINNIVGVVCVWNEVQIVCI